MSTTTIKLAAMLVALALLATACPGSDPDPDPDEGVVATACTEFKEPDQTSHNDDDPSIVDGSLLLVVVDDGDDPNRVKAAISDELGNALAEAISPVDDRDQFDEVLNGRYRGVGRAPLLDGPLANDVLQSVVIGRLNDGPNVLVRRQIELLRQAGFDARPLYAVKYEGHWTRVPAVAPRKIEGATDERLKVMAAIEAAGESPAHRIGVVDSGFTAGSASFVNFDPARDTEDPTAFGQQPCYGSHGTFVAGVLRTAHPETELFGAGAAPLADPAADAFVRSDNTPIGSSNVEHTLTDELAVLDAIDRMAAMAEYKLDALNMSFGTYGALTEYPDVVADRPEVIEFPVDDVVAADFPQSIPPALLGPALARISQGIPDIELVAGGGNQTLRAPFFPAAYRAVLGVGALSAAGDDVLWDENHQADPTISFVEYPWIERAELGCDVVGVGTDGADELTIWSGSSFAAPLATARLLNGTPEGQPGPAVADLSNHPAIAAVYAGGQCGP